MERNLQQLPPLKRYRLMLQQEQKENTMPCLHLPAKKRKESRNPPPSPPLPPNSTTFCLPAKKRIWALQPDLIPQKPNSAFDLNVEYNPFFNENHEIELNESCKKETDRVGGEAEVKDELFTDVVLMKAFFTGTEKANEKESEEDDDNDGIVCAICLSTDGDPSDPIVFCDGCDLMVHTTCFGHPLVNGVPEGDWFCTHCLASQLSDSEPKKVALSCCLCSIKGGAMKPTSDGRWAHVVCALFIPEVFFGDPEGREGIECSKVPKWRWEQKCYVCQTESGCVVDCSERKCKLSFHVTCGLKENLCMEYVEGRNKGDIVAGFCKSHSDLWKKQQVTGKFKIVAREEHKK